MNQEERINYILNNLLSLASGNFDIKCLEHVENDNLDAIDQAVFMLGEHLGEREKEHASSLKEKELVIKEIHHRIKNNLQVISSLISLQSNFLTDATARKYFLNTQSRIKSVALIHEMLYNTKEIKTIRYSDYIKHLVRSLMDTYGDAKKIDIDIRESDIYLDLDTAIPLGLLLNEIVVNSLKHAFEGRDKGQIYVDMNCGPDNTFLVKVGDNGIGNNIGDTKSLGSELIQALTEQLGGHIKMTTLQGTHYEISFSASSKKQLNIPD